MSFILDALRKSETERQQQTAPGIADAPMRVPPATRNRWLPLLVVVLAANAVLIGVLVFRASPEPQADTTVTLPLPPADPRPADRRPLASMVEAGPVEPGPVEPGPVEPEPAPQPEPSPAPAREPEPAAAARAADTRDGRSPEPAGSAEPADGLPSLQQLLLAGALEMPPLRLDMHVYSDDPEQRFVFMNMRKYREGQRLDEGPLLDEITETGVILVHGGRRFTMERQ